MRFDQIPDDVGDPGVGSEFKEAFAKHVGRCEPIWTVEGYWNELWAIFDAGHARDEEMVLLVDIIEWFIDYMDQLYSDGQ